MLRFLGFGLILALQIYCVIDCIQTEDERIKGLPKPLWLVLIIVAPLVGGAAWWFAGKDRPRGFELPPALQPKPRPPAPRGPDDDPDFLRGLDKK